MFKIIHLDAWLYDQPIGRVNNINDFAIEKVNYFFRGYFSKETIFERNKLIRGNDIGERISWSDLHGEVEFDRAIRGLFEIKEEIVKNAELKFKKENVDYIDINYEIIVEINNLSHFNEMDNIILLTKLIRPDFHMYYSVSCFHFSEIQIAKLSKTFYFFTYGNNDNEIVICFRREKDENYVLFDLFDELNIDKEYISVDNDGYFVKFSNEIFDKLISHKGNSLIPVFYISKNIPHSFVPPVIRHDYVLRPLGDCEDKITVDKYFALYNSGNWNAKYALRRSGFKL